MTVNSSGIVTGIALGTATITVVSSNGNYSASSNITVISNVTGVTLPPFLLINVGEISQIKATISPSNAINKKVRWSSSNASIAIVDSFGSITGISHGSDTIKVTTDDANKTAFCIVTVTKWTTYTANFGLADHNIWSIAIDVQDNKWFGTYNGGILEYDGNNWTTYNMNNSGLVNNLIATIAISSQGEKWFGTGGFGISVFDGTNWKNYTRANGLVSDTIRALAIDGQDNKWIGTYNGISEFDGKIWTTFNINNSGLANSKLTPSNEVYAIAIDNQGNKWFGTSNGLSKFNGTNWTTYNITNSGLINNVVLAITIDKNNNKWIGTSNGLSKFDDYNWTSYNTGNSGLVNNSILVVTIDKHGNKWFGTPYGISKFDDVNWTTYKTNNGLNIYISAIAIDNQETKWIGTNVNGILKLQD